MLDCTAPSRLLVPASSSADRHLLPAPLFLRTCPAPRAPVPAALMTLPSGDARSLSRARRNWRAWTARRRSASRCCRRRRRSRRRQRSSFSGAPRRQRRRAPPPRRTPRGRRARAEYAGAHRMRGKGG
eukprot:6172985-Pleurochrysis_carterae.AAC.2